MWFGDGSIAIGTNGGSFRWWFFLACGGWRKTRSFDFDVVITGRIRIGIRIGIIGPSNGFWTHFDMVGVCVCGGKERGSWSTIGNVRAVARGGSGQMSNGKKYRTGRSFVRHSNHFLFVPFHSLFVIYVGTYGREEQRDV